MAQSTVGVKIGYGVGTVGEDGAVTAPSTWTKIPDISGFPSLGGTPSNIDVTTFDNEKNKTYISGLVDLGGVLEFSAIFTEELYTVVEDILTKQKTQVICFCIYFPDPLGKRIYWVGQALPLSPDEGAVDSALKATFRVTMTSDTEWEDATEF